MLQIISSDILLSKRCQRNERVDAVVLLAERFVAEGVGKHLYVTLNCERLASEMQWMLLDLNL